MRDIEGHCRTQRLLLPEVIDDYVTADNPVRVIDAYVEGLDLESLGVARAQAALTGRPADEPRDLLQLYIDGDRNRISSSRRLEREPHRHVERIWLLRKLRPDVKAIADFSKQHTKALQARFREFVLLGQQVDLCGAELLAIDGSKLKAVNSKHTNLTEAKLEKALKAIAEKMAQYVCDLDPAASEECRVHQPTSEERQDTIQRRQERQTRDHALVQELTASGETQLSLPAPESRARPKRPKVEVGYNVQIAGDSKQKLSVEPDVTKAVTDDDPLSPLAMRAQETLGVERLRAVADMGDSHGHESNTGEAAGLDAYVPKPSTSANTKLGLFGQERFTSDPEKDCSRCPQGADLTCRFETTALGRHIRSYATSACRRGPMKAQGTRNNAGRRMTRWVDAHILERREERLNAHPEIRQERKHLVEPPFGTIKHANDQGDFLMKGLKNVRAEFSLPCLAYHLKRVINILGVPRLLVALG